MAANIKYLIVVILLLLMAIEVGAKGTVYGISLGQDQSTQIDSVHLLSAGSQSDTLSRPRKKVGVVLSGGGAKGVAHVRALKVIEEAGIPIDYIAGTSMGAIVGGLYAIGYDIKTMDSLVRSQNWTLILSDRISRHDMSFSAKESKEKYILTIPLDMAKKPMLPSGLLGGNNVYNLLRELTVGYHDSLSFKEDLPTPFSCVAYDLVSGKAITLSEGNLALAIRASMSLPGAFDPIRTGNMVLIDGGIANNFPADVVRDMGAEIIIGVDVGANVRGKDEINNISDLFNQVTYFTGIEAFEQNKELVDIYIHPNIKPYSAASFAADAIDTLLNRGEVAVRGKWDELIALKKKIGVSEDYMPPTKSSKSMLKDNLHIGSVSFEGLVRQKEKSLERIAGIKENSVVSYDDIQKAVSKLRGIGSLSNVSARLESSATTYNLIFTIKEATRNSLSIGLRFDTEEKAAILLNASIALNKMSNSHFEITGRLSDNPYALGEYIVGDETQRKLKISYRYKYNDLNLYNVGKKETNLNFSNHTVDINYTNIQVRNFKAGIGLRYDYYDYNSILSNTLTRTDIKSEGIVSYYATLQFESLDRLYHPMRGISFNAGYTLYTSNFASYKGDRPFGALNASFYAPLSVSKRVCFIPGIFGRVLIGDNVAFPAINVMGGTTAGRYMPQHMPLVGLQHFERFENTVIGAKLDFRLRLWVKNFVSLKMNYLKEDPDFFEILGGKNVYGIGIEYSYNSIVGPLSFQIDYSNRDKRIGMYFNLGYYF